MAKKEKMTEHGREESHLPDICLQTATELENLEKIEIKKVGAFSLQYDFHQL